MVEEAGQLREDISNVDQSLVSLSRKCSNCGQTGHNSRTCLEMREPTASEAERKSATADSILTSARLQQADLPAGKAREDDAEASDCSAGASKDTKKKGVAWTEEEHKLFLKGLQKLGKGDWRGISRQFVQTRSPTQVASHAQKYFIRQSVVGKRKRRSSLFDLVPEGSQELKEPAEAHASVKTEDSGTQLPSQPINHDVRPQDGGPPSVQSAEAMAFAYWYQNMLLQQGPMAWMQALYGMQSPFIASSMTPAGAGPPALKQGDQASPTLMQERELAFATMAAQQQQAAALYAQQYLSAAMAIGTCPYTAFNQGVEGLSDRANMREKGKPPYSDKAELMEGVSNQKQIQQASSVDTSTEHLRHLYEQAPPEVFGNGRLVRPKAHRVQSGQSLASMHGYVSSQSNGRSQITTCSKDSQDSLAVLAGVSGKADPSSFACGGSGLGLGALGVEKSAYTGGTGSVIGFGASCGSEKPTTSEDSRTFRRIVPE